MKVLHLPSNVAGNAFGLAQGERSLGLDSKVISFNSTNYRFPSDIQTGASRNLLSQLYYRLNSFIKIRQKYDVYHFNAGSSLLHYYHMGLNLIDLPFYSQNSRKFVTYQGCDARQKYTTIKRRKNKGVSACDFKDCYNGICNSGRRDKFRQKSIEKMMLHCEHAFALNPDLLHFLPEENSSFLPYTVPNFDKIPEKTNSFFEGDKIHIIHAPTQRVTKGSQFIIEAINLLQRQFPNRIDFRLIENIPYSQALKLYNTADLVIDQLLIGWYGGFAVEVMKMGIPVIAFLNEDDFRFIPQEFLKELPVINATTQSIYLVLKQLITEREQLQVIGQKCKAFVEKWHAPQNVAAMTLKAYQA